MLECAGCRQFDDLPGPRAPGFLPALLVTALIVGLTVVLARHTEQRRQPYTAFARRILGGRPAP